MMEWGVDAGLVVIRTVVGVSLIFHGGQKLGWFGGEGLHGATAFFQRLGYRPPRLMAVIAAVLETVGGALLLLGLLTHIAAAAAIATLVNVIALHLRNGFDRRNNGIEYEFVLIGGVVGIALAGPGALSLDAVLGVDLAALALGVAGLDLRAMWGPLLVLVGVAGGVAVAASRRPARTAS